MHISAFDLFKIGIGPSSSHTVGPMLAAERFARQLEREELKPRVTRITVELFGSLGFTGKGHGSDLAVLLGLEGALPATCDIDAGPARVAEIATTGRLSLLGHSVPFEVKTDLVFHRREKLPLHSNGMRFTARAGDSVVLERIYYSVGGGFVVDHDGKPTVEAARRRPCATRFRPVKTCSSSATPTACRFRP